MSKYIGEVELVKQVTASLKGILILKDGIPFLVDDGGSPEISLRLEPADKIRIFLLENVFSRLGGRYLFEESAEANLTLIETAVAMVDQITVYQDGAEFHFRT